MMENQSLFPGVRIVLVETSHPGNIGAAARAMKNMGLTELVLVNPRSFPSNTAVFRSASAADVVNGARVVDSIESAIADCQLVLGTSARNRRIPWPLLNPKSCGEKILSAQAAGQKIAILFGRESHGLSNEELHLCHYHINIPTEKAYSSLNLAMAVQIICYEILLARQAGHDDEVEWDMEFATAEDMQHFFVHLEETLVQVGFHDLENPRRLMTRLVRMFNRIRPDKMEISILRGFLNAINKNRSN